MIKNKKLLIGIKLFLGLLGFSALVTELATLVDRGQLDIVNFFSYFTIQANMVAIASLLLSAIAVAGGKNASLGAFRSAATVYILIVGIGFAALLSGLDGVEFTAVPWDNVVLHYLMPAVVLLDLVIDRPQKRLLFKGELIWLLFPVAYFAYSLIRGAVVGWYPYPFLNPASGGYVKVVIAALGVAALSVGLVWLVTKLSVDTKFSSHRVKAHKA
jgi:hypothetical protein